MNTLLKYCLIGFILNFTYVTYAAEVKSPKMLQAEQAYAKANYDNALKLFNELIAEGNTAGECRFFIGIILESKREFAKSIPYFIEAVSLSLKKEYYIASLWKLILYFQQIQDYPSVLTYSSKLKNKIGSNEQLDSIIHEAEAKASPAKMEARSLVNESLELEKKIFVNKNQLNFWENNITSIIKIANNYERASRLDDTFSNLLWKSANYYEKIEKYSLAIKIYKDLTNKPKNADNAKYKLGVLYKKLNDYQNSKNYFMEAIQGNQSNGILYYYTYANLGKVYLALGDLNNAHVYSLKALDPKYNSYRKAKSKNIIILNLCIATYSFQDIVTISNNPTATEVIKKIKDKDKQCNIETISLNQLTNSEKYLYHIALAKKQHFYSLIPEISEHIKHSKNDKNKDNNETLKQSAIHHYSLAFIPEYITTTDTQEIDTTKLEDTSDDEDEDIFYALYELPQITHFLFNIKKYEQVYYITKKYYEILKQQPDFFIWKSTSSYHQEEYTIAIEAFNKLTNKNIEQEKMLLNSYAHLKNWKAIYNEFKNYIKMKQNEYSLLYDYIKNETIFQEMKMQPDYHTFTEEVKSMVNTFVIQ